MGTHLIPRNVEGEGRILIIFTTKGLIFTLIGLGIGFIFYTIFAALGATIVGIAIAAILAGAGFVIGQVKLPDSNAFDLLKKTGGEYIDDVAKKYIKFRKNRKIYLYDNIKKKEE